MDTDADVSYVRFSVAERVVISAADEGESFIELLSLWTINTPAAADWDAKQPYVESIQTAALSLLERNYICLSQSYSGVVDADESRRAILDVENWWTPIDDTRPDTNGYFFDLTSRGEAIKRKALIGYQEIPADPLTAEQGGPK